MRVCFVGPPMSGKSVLFAAVAEAGGSNVDLSRRDQPHLAVVKVPDERIDWLAELHKPKKVTLAELAFLDLPGFDLRDQATRNRARAHWQAMRQCDMIVLVARARICDTDAIRKRVLNDEVTLAADVHDIEPLPLDDPLVGRHNVIHTPHIAGRTMDAKKQ